MKLLTAPAEGLSRESVETLEHLLYYTNGKACVALLAPRVALVEGKDIAGLPAGEREEKLLEAAGIAAHSPPDFEGLYMDDEGGVVVLARRVHVFLPAGSFTVKGKYGEMEIDPKDCFAARAEAQAALENPKILAVATA